MPKTIKKYIPYILILSLVCVFAYLMRSHSSQWEKEKQSYKQEIHSLTLTSSKLNETIQSQKEEITKLEKKSKAKSIDVEVIKNADGSSRRVVKVRESESSEKGELTKKENERKELVEERKELVEVKAKEEVVKEKEKKKESSSNWGTFLIIAGGIAIFILTGVPISL